MINDVEKGRADKGSQLLIQEYVNNREGKLNNLILMNSASLLSFIDNELAIQWLSPLKERSFKEYRNEFLELNEEWKDKRVELEKYWAKKGPQWDGLALLQGKNGQKGLLLVEAKAHTKEMRSKMQAKDEVSKTIIKSTLDEVKTAIGSKASLDVWCEEYYQLSNRLAYLYILNQKMNIPTWLILVNFVDDSTHKSTTITEWIQHYQEVLAKMDISYNSDLLSKVISIYPSGE